MHMKSRTKTQYAKIEVGEGYFLLQGSKHHFSEELARVSLMRRYLLFPANWHSSRHQGTWELQLNLWPLFSNYTDNEANDRVFSMLHFSVIFPFLNPWHMLPPGKHSQVLEKCISTHEYERRAWKRIIVLPLAVIFFICGCDLSIVYWSYFQVWNLSSVWVNRIKHPSPSQEKSMNQQLVCNPCCHTNTGDLPAPPELLQEGRREWWVQTVLEYYVLRWTEL